MSNTLSYINMGVKRKRTTDYSAQKSIQILCKSSEEHVTLISE